MTLEEKLKSLPARPGVYLMKDAKGRVIYVGKAKSLKNRVRSYFQATPDPDPRRAQMAELISDFETVITANELEAFILESNLIKKHKPRYNVVLRDDKNYPYLKLTVNEDFPSLSVVRRVEKDGALYFGPFVPSGPMWETLRFIGRLFPMRKCAKKGIGAKLGRPCLQFEMKRCSGPCGGEISKAEYRRMVDEVRMLLLGRDKEIVRGLGRKMKAAADATNFEAAANIRDRMDALTKATQAQNIISAGMEDKDLIAVCKEGAAADIQILFVRGGKLIGRKDFYVEDALESPEGVLLAGFVNQFYTEGKEVPPEVLVSHGPPERGLVAGFLEGRRGRAVRLGVPRRGRWAKLMAMALENARISLGQNLRTEGGRRLTLMALQSELGLRKLPRRIEAFDVSNTGGREAVGSMVSFVDGVPDKSGYRHFRIKTVGQADDFAMMQEVIHRRYRRVTEEGGEWPDLIMVDGGKGQLGAALDALGGLGADTAGLDVIGLAKAREKGLRYSGVAESRAFERVFRPGEKDAKILSPTSAAVNLLAKARDESHRFAIAYHRKLRRDRAASSPLDDVPGVGGKRKAALLKHMGSLRALREAGVDEIAAVPGIPRKVAEELYAALRK